MTGRKNPGSDQRRHYRAVIVLAFALIPVLLLAGACGGTKKADEEADKNTTSQLSKNSPAYTVEGLSEFLSLIHI